MNMLFAAGRTSQLIMTIVGAYLIAMGILILAPQSAFFRSPIKNVYSSRSEAMIRLSATTLLLASFPMIRSLTESTREGTSSFFGLGHS